MFSPRVPAELASNAFARAVSRARRAGRPLVDLTVSNPTRAGLVHPPEVFSALGRGESARYAPEPFGSRAAREAVARDYRRRGLAVDPDRIVLTSSTSEAYSLLFKLMCAPAGDAVLVPVPSYPLFEHLTMLDGVTARPYRLEYHGRWAFDFASVDAAWRNDVRAVLSVSPNNPTGSVATPSESSALDARAAARDAAVIVDEVFIDYPLEPAVEDRPVATGPAQTTALTFRLGGLSKSAALPQVKLGWIAVEGPEALVEAALERLELIADTYLSVSTPVQVAAADLIEAGAPIRAAIQQRIQRNYQELRACAGRHPAVDVLHAEAGWSAVLRVPAVRSEEEIAIDLVEREGIVVHPGFFFDFPREAYLVLSLLPEPGAFADAVRRVLERVDG